MYDTKIFYTIYLHFLPVKIKKKENIMVQSTIDVLILHNFYTIYHHFITIYFNQLLPVIIIIIRSIVELRFYR